MHIWFTSDEHVGHRNACFGWGNPDKARPFTGVDDMREGLIRNHNEVVKTGDMVFHLGDIFWRSVSKEDALDYMDRLHGRHFYIRGNHEEAFEKYPALESRFHWIKDRYFLNGMDGGPKYGIVLDHFSGRVWNKSGQGSWQLYGHSHNELESREDSKSLLSCDVGVDSWGMYPVSLEQIAEVMRVKKEYRDGNTGD